MSSTGGSDGDADIENRLMAAGGEVGRRGWGKCRESPGNIHITIWKADSQWGFAI